MAVYFWLGVSTKTVSLVSAACNHAGSNHAGSNQAVLCQMWASGDNYVYGIEHFSKVADLFSTCHMLPTHGEPRGIII